MKRIVAVVAMVLSTLLFGCASAPQSTAMDGLADNRQQMDQLRGQIDRTVYLLDSLVRAPAPEIKESYTRYAAAVASLRQMANRLDADATATHQRQIDYLTEWERAQLSVENDALKRATEQRQQEVIRNLASLESSLRSANQSVAPLVTELEDVERVVRNDPTLGGINSVKKSGIVQNAQRQASTANYRLDLAASRFDSALAALSPQPGVRPVAATAMTTPPVAGASAGGDSVAALPSFKQADRNANSVIEPDEAQQIPGLNFLSADVDKDGTLNDSEYEAARKARAASAANGGGKKR